MSQTIHGDISARVVVDTKTLPWTASPSGTVWRKRLHLVGPSESGQVTSVVRFQENSHFASHDHPEGEEILVLEGVFSDEHGDCPAGSYLLNPEGFRHAPYSRDGCLLPGSSLGELSYRRGGQRRAWHPTDVGTAARRGLDRNCDSLDLKI